MTTEDNFDGSVESSSVEKICMDCFSIIGLFT